MEHFSKSHRFAHFTKSWFGFAFHYSVLKRNLRIIFTLLFLTIGLYSSLPFRFATIWHRYVPAENIVSDLYIPPYKPINNINELKFCRIPQVFSGKKLDEIDELQLLYNESISDSSLTYLPGKYNIKHGGEWNPVSCKSLFRIAIIVPYRNRKHHLNIFLSYIHPFLQKQNIHYRIFIIEQSSLYKFNRGKILNIGFAEVNKKWDYDCFIFHDIDLLPEKLQNLYACSKLPRHASSSVNSLRYNLPYRNMFGGVTAMRKHHFISANGYSNLYYGWGGEDDEMYERLKNKGFDVVRWDPKVARYSMVFHPRSVSLSENRHTLINSYQDRYHSDGLNSLYYNLIKIEERPLYTWVFVDINNK
ncbi:Beta-1,4-N-acetylgalactosaminyltransferase bre-4 [Nymphon striatum]|nr:Beta-1,4-N-acetylgalactosaminyltransferase bre-4 [Nymphon striatum]KAG1714938.1 Beta-1,4-N-acetylgalactosaminyltransferase bre-4 [Nymphon striatum]